MKRKGIGEGKAIERWQQNAILQLKSIFAVTFSTFVNSASQRRVRSAVIKRFCRLTAAVFESTQSKIKYRSYYRRWRK